AYSCRLAAVARIGNVMPYTLPWDKEPRESLLDVLALTLADRDRRVVAKAIEAIGMAGFFAARLLKAVDETPVDPGDADAGCRKAMTVFSISSQDDPLRKK